MKNILKTLAIVLTLSFGIMSCSKTPLEPLKPKSSYENYIYAYRLDQIGYDKNGTPNSYSQYTGYLKEGNYCGDVVSFSVQDSNWVDMYNEKGIIYDVRVKSNNELYPATNPKDKYQTTGFMLIYKKTDVQPNYKLGDKFCIDRPW